MTLAFITAREIASVIEDKLPPKPSQFDVTVAMRQCGFGSCCPDASQVHDMVVGNSPAKRIAESVRAWIKLSPGRLTPDQARRATDLFCEVHGKLLPKVYAEVVDHLSKEDR